MVPALPKSLFHSLSLSLSHTHTHTNAYSCRLHSHSLPCNFWNFTLKPSIDSSLLTLFCLSSQTQDFSPHDFWFLCHLPCRRRCCCCCWVFRFFVGLNLNRDLVVPNLSHNRLLQCCLFSCNFFAEVGLQIATQSYTHTHTYTYSVLPFCFVLCFVGFCVDHGFREGKLVASLAQPDQHACSLIPACKRSNFGFELGFGREGRKVIKQSPEALVDCTKTGKRIVLAF